MPWSLQWCSTHSFLPHTLTQKTNLLLALGEYPWADLPAVGSSFAASPEAVVRQLRHSPVTSLRSAAIWCWRRWGQTDDPAEPRTLDSESNWYSDVNGHEMILVDTRHNAEPFEMDSYLSEPGASWDERKHLKWIQRRFAVCAFETTVEQFQQFVASKPDTPFAFRGDIETQVPVTRQLAVGCRILQLAQ